MQKLEIPFSELSKALRGKLRLSQENFAHLVSISNRTISRGETEEGIVSSIYTERLFMLNAYVDELLRIGHERDQILDALMVLRKHDFRNLSAVLPATPRPSEKAKRGELALK